MTLSINQINYLQFLIPSLETPWQSPEELAAKDAKALEVDPRNEFKYAPNGLTIVKVSELD